MSRRENKNNSIQLIYIYEREIGETERHCKKST